MSPYTLENKGNKSVKKTVIVGVIVVIICIAICCVIGFMSDNDETEQKTNDINEKREIWCKGELWQRKQIKKVLWIYQIK